MSNRRRRLKTIRSQQSKTTSQEDKIVRAVALDPHPKTKQNDETSAVFSIDSELSPFTEGTITNGLTAKSEKAGGTERPESSRTLWPIAFSAILTLVAILQFHLASTVFEANKNDQRAWLSVKGVKSVEGQSDTLGVLGAGVPVMFPIEVKNVGKTVATNLELFAFVEVLKNDQGPNLSNVGNPNAVAIHSMTGDFFPDEDFKKQISRIYLKGGLQLGTQAEKDAVDSGQSYLVVYGVLVYDDVFKVRHWTKFCQFDPGSATYAAVGECGAFNSVGDGSPF